MKRITILTLLSLVFFARVNAELLDYAREASKLPVAFAIVREDSLQDRGEL